MRLSAPARGSEHAPPPAGQPAEELRVNPVKALVPIVPIALLFLAGPPLHLVEVPDAWLVPEDAPAAVRQLAKSRLIGAAMLVGVVAAALVSPRSVPKLAGTFFEGAGYAFANIIAVIVTASCFGEGVKQTGLAALAGGAVSEHPVALLAGAGALPLAFAAVSGSGIASTQSLFTFFAAPSLELGIHPAHTGAVVALASAAGRTMSPVAAVVIMCATLTRTSPFDLARRVAVPLILGVVAVVVAAVLMVVAS